MLVADVEPSAKTAVQAFVVRDLMLMADFFPDGSRQADEHTGRRLSRYERDLASIEGDAIDVTTDHRGCWSRLGLRTTGSSAQHCC